MTYSPPRPYEFNEWDRDQFRYWACPVSLFTQLPKLTPATVSALPPLSFLAFPERTKDAASLHPHLAKPSSDWTVWATVSMRWLGALAGFDKGVSRRALACLCENRLAEVDTVARPKHQGGYQTVLRLSRRIFAAKGEPVVQIPGSLVFSGTWMLLPTHSARCVYLAIACLSAVRNPDALARVLEDSGVPDWEEEIEERRSNSPVSLALLEQVTGYQRSTIIEAISILTKPIFGNHASRFGLVSQGRASKGLAHTYWINKEAHEWRFEPDSLNVSASDLQDLRDRQWPELQRKRFERRQALKKRRLSARIREAKRADKVPSPQVGLNATV